MRIKVKHYIHIIFLFYSTTIMNINSHNIKNGGCGEHCEYHYHKTKKGDKSLKLKKDKNFIEESNSCLNNYLCRG